VAASYTPVGLGQNGADGLHGLEELPCDMFFKIHVMCSVYNVNYQISKALPRFML
jgi:hypothetical protein